MVGTLGLQVGLFVSGPWFGMVVMFSTLFVVAAVIERGAASRKGGAVLPDVPLPDSAVSSSLDLACCVRPPSLRHSLISPPVRFEGHAALLTEMRANFDRGVLITSATGSLGGGMTALARRLALDLAPDFPDGCLELDLRGGMPAVMEPLSLEEAQRRLLWPFAGGATLPDDPKALDALYRETFSGHKVLLLLDNASGPAQLRRLMPKKPSAAIVTSRETFPALAKLYPVTLPALKPEEARVILFNIAPHCAAMPPRTINKILDRFGDNPMALRLVGALLRKPYAWTPRALLSAYAAARKRLLALRNSDGNLNVTIASELVYEALPEAIRPYFEALAVFPAPFSKTAACAVWNVDANAADEVLVTLVRSNLVMYYPDLDAYALHDLISAYAQELLLGQSDRARVVIARFAHYALAEATLASDYCRAGSSYADEGMLRFTLIWPHLWAAWLRMGTTDPGWMRPRHTDQWLVDFSTRIMPVLTLGLTMSQRLAVLERGLEAAHHLDRAAEAMILAGLGQVYMMQGDARQALGYYEQYLKIVCELHDRKSEAEALMHIGTARGALRDFKRAQENWRHALALFKMIEDPRAAQVRAWLEALEQKIAP